MRAHAETYAASGSDRVGFSRGQQHGAEKETLCSLHVLCIAFKFMLHKEEEGVPDLYENCRTSFLKSHMQPIFKRAKKDKTHLRCHDAEHFVYLVHLLMSWRCVCIYVCVRVCGCMWHQKAVQKYIWICLNVSRNCSQNNVHRAIPEVQSAQNAAYNRNTHWISHLHDISLYWRCLGNICRSRNVWSFKILLNLPADN